MSNTGGFDFSKFFTAASEEQARQTAAAVSAVDAFGEHVLGDAQTLAPIGAPPKDPAPGTLRASATPEPAKLEGTVIKKQIGFNTEYAAVQHEDLAFNHPNGGEAKYMTTALKNNTDKFSPFVAGRMKAAET